MIVRYPVLAAPLAAALFATIAPAQTYPADFVDESVSGGFNQPTCLCFASADDLLVADKGGVVWDVHRGFKHVKPVLDLQQEILSSGDRGLMSIAVDPGFAGNGYLYLLYVVDPNGDGNDWEQESFGRLTRYTAAFDINGDLVADPASRTILIGATWSEGIPSLHFSHGPGDLHFASDGSLLVSTGDGAHWDFTDFGGHDPNGFGSGKFDSSEDIGAFRSQSVTSLAGKLLRIDPATGDGLPDNPYWTGSGTDNASRLWMTGLRNPFRFCLDPGSGPVERLVIGDVGWFIWEEIDRGVGAENFGWPCWEGPALNKSYANSNPFGLCKDSSIFTHPLLTWNHTDPKTAGYTGNCITGVAIYTGLLYPQIYQGRLFYCDYGQNWIRAVPFVSDQPAQPVLFASGLNGPIDLTTDPATGDLYYVSMGDSIVHHIRYTQTNFPPTAVAAVTPTFGALPLTVALDATGSSDPEGSALTYDWDLGDGNHSSLATLTHVYSAAQNYSITLTVTDAGGETGTSTVAISPGNTPPAITAIVSPPPGSFYNDGQTLTFSATATDAEDDLVPLPLAYHWQFDVVEDDAVHTAFAARDGATVDYAPTDFGEASYLRVTLTVTDQRGLTDARTFDLYDLDVEPDPVIEEVSNLAPRVGHEIVANGHVFYPGKGPVELTFDWGDGANESFVVGHDQDCLPHHTYLAPGTFELRLTASDGIVSNVATQPIVVRPKLPAVAIFAPLVSPRALSIDARWQIATQLADDLHNAGFEAQILGVFDQTRLADWMEEYLHDDVRDWLVCLDLGASTVYAGQKQGSLAERWLEAGKGVVWTGYTPFARYVTADGEDLRRHAGPLALDDLLDPATPQLIAGSGHMDLAADAVELPSLQPFDTVRALETGRLGADWKIVKLYAGDGGSPPASDALVVRHKHGGEYAQFLCADDSTLPRADVLREFFLSHVYVDLPQGPVPFDLIAPPAQARGVDAAPTLTWQAGAGATSWRVEVATDAAFRDVVRVATVARTGGADLQRTASWTVTPALDAGQLYRWRVTAGNDFGTTASSTVRSFRVAP